MGIGLKKIATAAALAAALTLGGAAAAYAYPIPPSGNVTLPAGGTQTLDFSGFQPGESLFISIPDATSITLAADGSFKADDNGELSVVATFEAPGEYPAQVYRGTSASGTPVVDTTLIVTDVPAPAPAPTEDASDEPTEEATAVSAETGTGADAAPWIWGGIGVIVLAGIITWIAVAAKRRNAA